MIPNPPLDDFPVIYDHNSSSIRFFRQPSPQIIFFLLSTSLLLSHTSLARFSGCYKFSSEKTCVFPASAARICALFPPFSFNLFYVTKLYDNFVFWWFHSFFSDETTSSPVTSLLLRQEQEI